MFPKIFQIGDFFLPTYGVLVALGFLAGLAITSRLARRYSLDNEAVTNLGIYVALAGLIGAKLLMLLYDVPYYLRNPGEILSFSTLQAGGVFYGGLVLALLTAIWYLRRHRLPGLLTADAFAPGIAAGHAIGRLGCFAAGCCWGVECDRPWAVTFTNPDAHTLVGVPLGVPLHPTQLYESFAEALIFLALYRLSLKPHPPGRIIGLYLVLYPVSRFLVEFFRTHEQANPWGLPISLAQWITLGLVVAGVLILLRSRGTNSQIAVSLAK